MTHPTLPPAAVRRTRPLYCQKHAFARFAPVVQTDRSASGRFRTLGSVDYERITTNASDGSIDRYYDPATMQFLSVDPQVAVTGQPYGFVGNDPLNEVDPLGNFYYGYGSSRVRARHHARGRCHNLSLTRSSPYHGVSHTITSPEKDFDFGIATLSVQASATITGPDEDPSVSVDQNLVAQVNVNGNKGSFQSNGDYNVNIPGVNGISISNGGLQATVQETFDMGGDSITTDVMATITPHSDPFPWREVIKGAVVAASAVETVCVANALACMVAAAPAGA
jgi:RHS repeat-associated protein